MKRAMHGKRLNMVVPEDKIMRLGLTTGKAEQLVVKSIKNKSKLPGNKVVEFGFESLLESSIISAYVRGWKPVRIARVYGLPETYVRGAIKKTVTAVQSAALRGKKAHSSLKAATERREELGYLSEVTERLREEGFRAPKNISERELTSRLTKAVEELKISKYHADLIARGLIKNKLIESLR